MIARERHMDRKIANPTQRLIAYLEANQAKYKLLQHAECRTSEECRMARASCGAPDAIGAKALLIKAELNSGEKYFYLLILPGHGRADKKLLKIAIKDLKGFVLTSPEEIAKIMDGLVPGTVPPFGGVLFPDIKQTYIDQSLFDHPEIGFNAACLTQSIVMSSREYQRIIKDAETIQFAIYE